MACPFSAESPVSRSLQDRVEEEVTYAASWYNESMQSNQRRTFRCLRCGFIWLEFVADEEAKPDVCPVCNSQEWDKSKKIPPRK